MYHDSLMSNFEYIFKSRNVILALPELDILCIMQDIFVSVW